MDATRLSYSIDHVHLRSRDPVAAAGFYVAVFGAREEGRVGDPVSRVVLDLGGLRVFIEQAPADIASAAVPPHRGIEHIGLRVADIDAALADLEARGVPLAIPLTQVNPALRTAFLDGPDGVRIELLERGGKA
ncbi:VOC family protein [Methylobacterium radiodurans]|uniref:Glyoxalase n=1 Tax=Methylobacterium radiodurans TaxID=2202828 RepID=A0A2U8VMA9_9HYPH|nr:VOC family protein [Methylobacterium radiodurans]AWN34707.1 glyoxalase [Methylobacterium radiodurans]